MAKGSSKLKLISNFIDISPLSYTIYDLVKDTLLITTKDPMEMLGISRKELAEMSHTYYQYIIHPDDYPLINASYEKMKRAGLNDHFEHTVRVRHKDGHYIWIHAIYRIHEVDELGNASKMLGVVEDISELKELESRLDVTVKKLNKISYRDSHILRAPIASILGLVELLEVEPSLPTPCKSIISHLKSTVRKLDKIVTDINQR